jgi:NAD(P)-dependent dehydrogenase (short-subunit alcohol dehydrogenase family)
MDYGTAGIRVNAVCPGWARTNILPEEAWETDFVSLY